MRLQAEPGLAHEASRDFNPYYNYTAAIQLYHVGAHHEYLNRTVGVMGTKPYNNTVYSIKAVSITN